MKKIFAIIGTLLTISMSAIAAETIDLGALSLDTNYDLTPFKGYKASFTPENSGVMTMSSTTTDDLMPFSDADCTQEISVTKNNQFGAHTYDMNVEAGVTYYFYKSFIMNSGTTVSISMPGTLQLTLEDSSPEMGGVFNVSNGGQVSFSFNKAVKFSKATITLGNKTQEIAARVTDNSIFTNDTKELVWDALQDRTVSPGDSFSINITGVCMAANNDILLNGDGNLVAKYAVGKMPITLESTENTSGELLSYYTTTNEKGIVKFHFSGKVNTEKLTAVLKFGDLDKDPEGGYYQENLPVTLSQDSTTVIVNLQGKRRKIKDMISTDDVYDKITLGITGVMDKEGNYAYASGSGSLGSYWYVYDYKEITANVFADFTPASGGIINSSTKNMEIWVTDEPMLSYDGIEFAYETAAGKDTTLVTDYTKVKDTEDETATILTVPVPEAAKLANNVVVTFRNLQSADGSDFSSVLRAVYNVPEGFKITSINPAAGECTGIQKNSYWTFTTNMDDNANFKAVMYEFYDATAKSSLYNTVATKASKYNTVTDYPDVWAVKNYSSAITDFKKGHEIRLIIKALDNEAPTQANVIGKDSVIYTGAGTAEYEYSPATVNISPAAGTEITKATDNSFILTFSQPVRLDKYKTELITGQMTTESFQNITASEDSTLWTLVVKPSTIEGTTPQLYFNVYGSDMDGKTLEGNNSGAYRMEEKSYYKFKYECYLGSPALVVEPAAGVVSRLKEFKLSYNGGIDLSYAAGVADLTVTNEAGETVATIPDKDKETAYTIDNQDHAYVTFSLPAEITSPGKYTLNIPSKLFALGTEFDGYTSKTQTVEYNIQTDALKVASVNPQDKAELDKFPEMLTVTFNNPDAVAYANYQLVDNNAADPTDNVVFSAEFAKNDDNTFISKAGKWVDCRLYTGHTYSLKIKTWGDVNDYNYGNSPSAELDAATWTGTTTPFTYSTVTVENTNPADQTVIKKGDFNITFSDAVASVKAELLTGVGGDNNSCEVTAGNDGNKTWTITIPESVIKTATGSINIFIVAEDAEDKYVKGNCGADPDTTYQVTYNCYEGAPEFTISPADGSTVDRIDTLQCSYSGKINPSWNLVIGYIEKNDERVSEFFCDNVTVNDDNTIATVTLTNAITENGTYKVVFPATFFALGEEFSGCASKEQYVNLTIAPTAVRNVDTDGKNTEMKVIKTADFIIRFRADTTEKQQEHKNAVRYNFNGQKVK